jgi:hypothetical protein
MSGGPKENQENSQDSRSPADNFKVGPLGYEASVKH